MSHPASPPRRHQTTLMAATLWVYRQLLFLHPPAFRREFGSSITQVFAQTCRDAERVAGGGGVMRLWLPALRDLLWGALAEYISVITQLWKGAIGMSQYRRSASIIFAAYIAFVLAGMSFSKMSEDMMKSSLPASHPILIIAYDAVAVGAIIALVAILVGGLPIAWAAFRFALANGRRDILARFAVPPIAFIVLAGYIIVMGALKVGGTTAATIHTPGRIFAVGPMVIILLVGAVASTAAVLDAIRRSDVAESLFRFSLLSGVLATLAMLCMLMATIAWSFSLWQDAPTYFFGNEGFLATSTLFYICLQLILMVAATGVATYALFQARSARTAPQLA